MKLFQTENPMNKLLLAALLEAQAHVSRQQFAGSHEQDRADAVGWLEKWSELMEWARAQASPVLPHYLVERPHLTDDERNRDPESGYIVHSREALAATGWRDPHRKLHDACDEPRAPGCPDPLSCPTHRGGYED
jgi:hypothetical protein